MALRIVKRFVWVLPGLAAALTQAGCGGGDGLPRHEVSGTVTLAGQPLNQGTIQFQPEGVTQGPAVSAGGVIAAGAFRIAQNDGLVPGTYKVLIFSHGGKGQPGETSDPGPQQSGAPPERIPAKYNSATTLTVVVSNDKPNVFPFDLKNE